MDSPDIILADDVVTAIRNRAWSIPVVPERSWVADWDDRAELTNLQVAVCPSLTPSATRFERGLMTFKETWPVDLTFGKRLQQGTRAEIDGLCNLVTEIVHCVRDQGYEIAGCAFESDGYEFLARFDPRQLNRSLRPSADGLTQEVVFAGLFLSVVQISFVKRQ